MNKENVLDIASAIKYYLCPSATPQAQSFGLDKYEGICPQDSFAVLSNEGWLTEKPPIRLDHYAVILCVKGSCTRRVGHFEFAVAPGTLHVVSPRHTSAYHQASDDLLLYIVLFRKDFMTNSFMKEAILEQLIDLDPYMPPCFHLQENFRHMKDIFLRMDREYRSANAFRVQMMKLQVVELLYEINRICEGGALQSQKYLSRQYQLVYRFRKMVEDDFLTIRTVQEYADRLHVTAKYLGEVVRNETGQSPLQLIHHQLYLEAQYLLSSTPYTIKEIADKLGFTTASHFSRFFKQYSGNNPSEFKINSCRCLTA
ncbi:helix-turn-helix transcriptional regulator [Chitinophaga agrisoli]|uniref:Helix-turn-helix transcriptional regulator n=1 Tax=Chitinophaga agrisoli TaxID=2607653 RepID=A0A5B2W0Z6_9BACT|nr:helix-turn-helix domain-containing protein [Chitinophaga agrisoli]KAA2244410.1 helix-turn-helix transcriptional regulator [Chitinophaga agrisoli]